VVLGIVDVEKRRRWWLLAPPLGIAAFLCKQTPTIFLVPFSAVVMLSVAWFDRKPGDLVYVIITSVLCLLVIILAFWSFGITWEMFRMETIDPARAIAEQKIFHAKMRVVQHSLKLLMVRIGLVPVFLLPGIMIFFSTFIALINRKTEPLILLLCSAGCFACFVVFTVVTNNQPATGLALLAVVFLLTHAACIRLYGGSDILFPITALAAVPAVVACAIQVGWTETRFLNDFYGMSLASYVDASEISPQLSHLRWIIPPETPGEHDVIRYRELTAELARRSRGTVLLSDSIIDPLIDRKTIAPALFWDPNLAFPVNGRARDIFDHQFKRNILESSSDLIVLDETFTGVSVQDFPWLNACLRNGQTRKIGGFSLVPLDLDCIRSRI
jgi:hypothetical protein